MNLTQAYINKTNPFHYQVFCANQKRGGRNLVSFVTYTLREVIKYFADSWGKLRTLSNLHT